jgi:DNA-binding transcriptional MocR family regulator
MVAQRYMRLAEAVAGDITLGRLKAGDQLPPQRDFAYQRGIAVSTASRVYAELFRRGLIVGEVGRGTFVAGRAGTSGGYTTEPTDSRIDLEFNFPMVPEQGRLLAKSMANLAQPEALANALRYTPSHGTASAREISARFLARGGWLPPPDSFLFTGNGRQAIASAIGAFVPIGARLGVEAITYPAIRRIAARLGATLVPLAMDEHGIRPDAIDKANREAPLSAVYLQPALHNPLGVTLS